MDKIQKLIAEAIWESVWTISEEDAELASTYVVEKLALQPEEVFEIPPWIQEPWVDEGRVHDASGKDVTDRLTKKRRYSTPWEVISRG